MSTSPWLRNRWESRDQRGELIAESLVTMLLMAIVLPSLLLLVTSLTFSAMAHRRSIAARNIATTVVESIDDMDYAATCDPVPTYATDIEPIPSGYEQPVITVRFLSPTTGPNPTVDFQDSCVPPISGGDQGLQEITVTVASSGTRPAHGSVTLVKRNDDCAAGAPNVLGQKC